MRVFVGGWSGRSRVVRALAAVLVGAATVLGPLAVPEFAAGQGGAVPDRPARPVVDEVGHDFVTLSWDDPGDATITGYQILRRNRDVDALGDFTVVEDDTASTDTVYTDHSVDEATNYGYRIKARNAHGLSLRSKAARVETLAEPETEPEAEPETESSESAESPSERDSDGDPESLTDTGTETGTDFVEAWTSVLDVGATDGTVGYSRWAQFGSLSPDRFDVDGTTYQVMLLAEIAGGLYLGLRASLDTEFVLEVDGEQFVGSQSLVPGGLALRGTYWWPADGGLSGSVGGALDVSLSVGTDALGERGASPPGAWFSRVPDAHDGSSQFTLRLNVDESNVGVTAGSMADALTVTGGSLADVSEVSPQGRTWELTVAPDGPGDVTVSLPAPTDCVTANSVCSADGRMLRNSPQATVQGPDDYADEASNGASLPVGATVRGQIETPGDEDWFAMELVKGNTYQIDLDGPALPYVAEVLDPAGNVISEETDPGGGSNGSEGSPQPRYKNIDGITGISGITKAPGGQTAGWDPGGASVVPVDDGDGLRRSVPSSGPLGGTDTTAFGDGWAQITPAESGTYYLSARSDKGTGDYEVSLRQVTDDYPADTTTTATVAVGGTAMGEIEQAGDTDWFEVVLEAGKAYLVDLMGAQTGDGSLRDPYLAGIHNSSGARISGTSNDDGGAGTNSRVRFTPASGGTFYVAARGAGDRIGTYTLAVTQQPDDFDATTTGTVTVDGTATGEIEAEGDLDWFEVTLDAGKTYRFDAKGKQLFQSLNGTLRNPYIDSLHRSDGTRIAGTHINDGGSYWDARIDHTATTAGTYYLSVGGYGEGTYTVAVTDITSGPPDDHPADTTTTAEITVGGTAAGEVQFHGDDDWFKVTLDANKTYYIDLMALHLTKGTLDWPTLHGIHDSNGTLIAGTANNDTFDGPSTSDRQVFTPTTTGVYYVAAGGPRLFVREGTYTVRVTDMTPGQDDDHPHTTASTATVDVGTPATARSEQAGDRDWYKVNLDANKVYRFDLMGAWTGDGTLDDPVLHGIRKADGTLINGTSDHDSGTYTNDRAFYTPHHDCRLLRGRRRPRRRHLHAGRHQHHRQPPRRPRRHHHRHHRHTRHRRLSHRRHRPSRRPRLVRRDPRSRDHLPVRPQGRTHRRRAPRLRDTERPLPPRHPRLQRHAYRGHLRRRQRRPQLQPGPLQSHRHRHPLHLRRRRQRHLHPVRRRARQRRPHRQHQHHRHRRRRRLSHRGTSNARATATGSRSRWTPTRPTASSSKEPAPATAPCATRT